MSQDEMTRRSFLELVPALIVVAPALREMVAQADTTIADRLGALVGHAQHAARAVGLRYLDQYPEDRDRSALVNIIHPSAESGPIGAASFGQVRALFQERVAADFEAGETVAIDGWILSRTEARLCALVALS